MNNLQTLLFDQIRNAQPTRRLMEQIGKAKPGKPLAIKGLRGSSLAAIVTELASSNSPERTLPFILLVTGNYERSGEIYDDLLFFGQQNTLHYPRTQLLPYDDDEPLLEEQVKHLEFLRH